MATTPRVLVIAGAVVAAVIGVAAPARGWVPPVHTGDAADPFVLDTGEGYIAYTTNHFLENVPMLHSSDLSTWEAAGDALPELGGWVDRTNPRVWAPSVLRRASTFVLYYTANDVRSHRQCVGRAVSSSADGPFVDLAAQPLVCQVELGGSIDPSPFVDTDGQPYLLWKSDGNCCGVATALWSQRLASDGLSLEGPGPSRLLAPKERWERGIVEAPSMVSVDGVYFLFYSGGQYESEAYGESSATCAGPSGPCTRASLPLLGQTPGWAGPGGGEVVRALSGALYLAFHAWPPDRVGYASGAVRRLYIFELTFEGGVPLLHSLGGGDLGFLGWAHVVAVAPLPEGTGFLLLHEDGSVTAEGAATTYGDLTGVRYSGAVVGVTPTPSGHGYWIYASDGGVFAFGDAAFIGSTGAMRLNRPVVGMAATPSGRGYWLVASDGGVFAFGDAAFTGSLGGLGFDEVVGISSTLSGRGYWLTDETGVLYAFGDAPPLA